MAQQEYGFGSLCTDLMVDILGRLPEKDVLKCKCVVKEWHRIVSHIYVPSLSAKTPFYGVYSRIARGAELPFVWSSCPEEAKDELRHMLAYRDSIHFIDTASLEPNYRSLYFCLHDEAPCAKMSLKNLLPFDHRGPDLLDCCNGLVLFVQRPKPQFLVCNPIIRQCVHVPLPPPSIHLSSLYASLAFDPSESIDYKVVISSLSSQPQCLHVFSSQDGVWKTHEVKIEPPTSAMSFKMVRHSIYLKNSLYRLSMFHKIICFDLTAMKACLVNIPIQKSPPNPPMDVKDQPPPGCLGVSNGFLSYVTDEEDYVCVWMFDKPNESSKWTLKYKICCHYLWKCSSTEFNPKLTLWLRCCGFHPTKDILFLSSSRTIFMYHIGSGRLDSIRKLIWHDAECGYYFPIFLHKNVFVTLKNWCRELTTNNDSYKDVQDRWCYIEE